MYLCIYMYVCMLVCIYIIMYVYMTYVYTYICTYVQCVCASVCLCVCLYVCVCVYVCVLSQDGHFSSNFSPVAVILLTLSLPNFTNVLLAARRKLRNVCKETKAGRYQTPTTIFRACTGLWLAHAWFLKIA